MNEQKPVIVEVTDIAVPLVCVGCGRTEEDIRVKRFGLQTSYLGSSRQIVAYCQSCAFDMAYALLRMWL